MLYLPMQNSANTTSNTSSALVLPVIWPSASAALRSFSAANSSRLRDSVDYANKQSLHMRVCAHCGAVSRVAAYHDRFVTDRCTLEGVSDGAAW
jgi:ribosomal protein S27AE